MGDEDGARPCVGERVCESAGPQYMSSTRHPVGRTMGTCPSW